MPDEAKPVVSAVPPLEAPAPVSPTGAPVLPPVVAKYALPLVAVAVALMMAPDAGIILPAGVLSAAKLVVLIGTMLGIVSPGARK